MNTTVTKKAKEWWESLSASAIPPHVDKARAAGKDTYYPISDDVIVWMYENRDTTVTKQEHTPGVARIEINNDNYLDIEADSRICSIDLIREDITPEEAKANAARIVKAWNMHQPLIDALHDVYDPYKTLSQELRRMAELLLSDDEDLQIGEWAEWCKKQAGKIESVLTKAQQ